MSTTKIVGLWTIVYNVLLFVCACALLFVVKKYPDYKIGLIIIIVGIFIVNINSMLRFYWLEQQRKAAEAAQKANIVPNHCPDYWVKVDSGNTVTCQNQFVTGHSRDSTVYRFGGSNAPSSYDLQALANMDNQTKCWNFGSSHSNNIPWVDMQNKCLDANV